MARPRIKQFAGDLSIDYGKAKNLIEKGRRRSDGGSQTLERNMSKMKQKKVDKVSKGLKKASKLHAGQAKTLDSSEFQDGGSNRIMTPTPLSQEDIVEGLVRRNIARKKEKERQTSRRGGPAARSKSQNMRSSKRKTYADGGSVNMSRGGGAAVKGTKFSGVY